MTVRRSLAKHVQPHDFRYDGHYEELQLYAMTFNRDNHPCPTETSSHVGDGSNIFPKLMNSQRNCGKCYHNICQNPDSPLTMRKERCHRTS